MSDRDPALLISDDDRFRLIFEQSDAAMGFTGLDGRVIDVNQAACEFWGRSRDELIGSSVLDLVHPDDRGMSVDNMRRLGNRLVSSIRIERRYIRGDGTVVWGDSSSRAVNGPDGNQRYWYSVIIDVTERRAAQEAAARLAAIVQSSPDAFISFSNTGLVTSWNGGAERLFGYAADEIVGTDGSALLPDRERGGDSDVLARALRGERVEDMQVMRTRKDGSLVIASITASAVRSPEGTLLGVASVLRDASERRQSAIIAASSDAIISVTLDGIITSWNPAAEALYGYPVSEVLGRSIAILIPEPGRDEDAGLMERILAGDRIAPFQTVRRCKDGHLVDVSMSAAPIKDVDDTIIGASRIARDVTALHAAERARRTTEEQLLTVVDNAPIALTLFDRNGVVTFHRVGRSLLDAGMGPRFEVGERLDDMLADQPENLERLRGVLAGGTFNAQVDASGRVLDVTYVPVRHEDGSTNGMIGLAIDVTDRVLAQRDRDTLEARLHQTERLNSLGELAGGVAHDFNNLLGVILNLSAFVRESVASDPIARRDVEEIERAAGRAAELTRQLLIFGRKDTVAPEFVDLNEIVGGLESLLTRTIGEHLNLVLRPAADPAVVRVDRGRLEQIVVNLAANARDAMTVGGTLTIEVAPHVLDEEAARLHVELKPGRYIRMSVSDTGTGMTEEVIAHAFEPFFTTKEAGRGTGLGLATVYGVVVEAGGAVAIYSDGGIGTTVHVYLPATDAAATAGGEVAPREPRDGAGMVILVVEDDEALRTVTERLLHRGGYHVLSAASGVEALEILSSQECDMLLTDVQMPVMSGRALVDRVHQLLPRLPVVFMSGYSFGVLGPEGVLDPDSDLIQKPFTEATLLAQVAEVLGRDGHPNTE
jgi:two-component system cell cycle sensor histidine kinase/response regulator CckA